MAKQIPLERRLTAPVITHVPLALRAEVEALATEAHVSLAEITRRALVRYLEEERRCGTTATK